MKRLLAALLITWIACFKLKGSDSLEYGQFLFSLDNDSVVSVAGILDTNAVEIRIPSSIYLDNKLFKVQNIQEGVFQKCWALSSLSIPNSIREIPVSIFSECQSLTDVFVDWSDPDSTYLFCPLADNSSDFIRLTAGMNLHVPSGSIKTYLNVGYPWIGFKTISDGNESIEVQTFISDGDIFNILDHDNKHVFAVFRERKGEFTVPAMVWSEKDSTFYTITGIGCRSFLNNKELTRVVLPESITEISFEAFRGCDNLMSIQMNDSISIIGSRAFYGCNRIDTIHFAQKLSSIDDYAFYGCENLQEVILPYNMRYLGNYTFEGCYGLRKVCLNDGLHHIGRACFKKCRMLDCIKIPETVDYIGYEAFEGCLNLRSVFVSWPGLSLLPKSFKIAFNINSMTELFVKPILMDSIIDNGIPAELTSFIHITDGMRSSMERAFISDSILYTVEDMKEKKVTARKIMANKSKIVIPGKVKSGYTDYVVTNVIISLNNRGCDSLIVSEGIRCMTGSLGAVELEYLYLPSTLDTVDLRYPLTLKSIGPTGSGCDIEYGWDEQIPDNSFRGLLSLETVVISEDIKTIGRNAFDWCPELKTIEVRTLQPPAIAPDTFNGSGFVLTVPKGGKKTYKKATGWNIYEIKENSFCQ